MRPTLQIEKNAVQTPRWAGGACGPRRAGECGQDASAGGEGGASRVNRPGGVPAGGSREVRRDSLACERQRVWGTYGLPATALRMFLVC